MIVKKNYIFKFFSFFLISFILSNLLTNALEENEINSTNNLTNITNHYSKKFNPIPIINRTLTKENIILFFSPSIKLGVCFVGKTGSIVTERIFCYLQKNSKQRKPGDFSHCEMNDKNYNTLDNFEKNYGVKKFNQFFKKYNFIRFVRNPIDRLISGFIHLCYYGLSNNKHYCYGCNRNLTCFVNELEKTLWKILNHKVIPYKKNENFYYSHYFHPQTWSCEYYKLDHMYTNIKYNSSNKDSFSNNIVKVLKNSFVPNNILDVIKKNIHNAKTPHVTFSKHITTIYKNVLYNNPLLIKKVCSIYYYDFIKFGFEFPQICTNSTNSKK
uniref:Sulfotransfer_1 domain-containing protein n=1 Tax=Strongyloides stercoralis TaxID=6248 RepID=A0A0K0ENZ0_STRER